MFDREQVCRLGLPFAGYVVGKLWYRQAGVDDLWWLLRPIHEVISFTLNSPGQWVDGLGYLHPSDNFVLNAGCAGFHFFLIAGLLFALVPAGRTKWWQQLFLAPLLAWPLTVLANSSRILALVILTRMGYTDFAAGPPHLALGTFVYLTFLLLTGLLLRSAAIHLKPSHA